MTIQLLGVDLGGTQIRAALSTSDGVMLRRMAALTLAHEGPEAVIERICAQIALAKGDEQINAIGIGAPGPTDPYEGIVLVAPNLPGWHNIPLRQILTRQFGVPVFIGNDANLAGSSRISLRRRAQDQQYDLHHGKHRHWRRRHKRQTAAFGSPRAGRRNRPYHDRPHGRNARTARGRHPGGAWRQVRTSRRACRKETGERAPERHSRLGERRHRSRDAADCSSRPPQQATTLRLTSLRLRVAIWAWGSPTCSTSLTRSGS